MKKNAKSSDVDPRDTCSGCFGFGPCVDPVRHGRTMGPIEAHLRAACARWPDQRAVIASAGIMYQARDVVYGASESLTGRTLSMAEMVIQSLLPDVLSEAIEAAEALGL